MDFTTIPVDAEKFGGGTFAQFKRVINDPQFQSIVLSNNAATIKNGILFWKIKDNDPYILVVDHERQTVNLIYTMDQPTSYLNLLSPRNERDLDLLDCVLDQIIDLL